MAVYNLTLKPSVEKDLRKIPASFVRLIIPKISQLSSDPFPPKSAKLAGGGHYYRIRIGDYRVIYEVYHSSKEVVVHYVRHRSEVYRSF